MVGRAEILVDQPLEEHTFEPGAGCSPLARRGNLADIEVPEQIASEVCKIEQRRIARDRAAA